MTKSLKILVLSLSMAIVLFVLAGGIGARASTPQQGAYRQLGVFSEVLSRIRSEYVEEPNFNAVTDGALHGLLESLDADSSYLSPEEYKKFKDRKNDGRASIGATVSKRFGYAAVVSVVPGGPAERAGIESGDILEGVEAKSTRDMSLAEIRAALVGQQGSNINFSVVRPRRAEPQKITVTRDIINIPASEEKMLEANIGYVKVLALTKGRSQEIAGRIKSLQKAGARKLVLDLRNVAEGETAEGVATANLFLNHGTIGYIQGQKYPRETFTADPQKAITNLPMTVLVNRGTAGAAELLAVALLENARADVVGSKTFGMGSVQKLIENPDGSALILSIAKYYSPSGKAIQDVAVTPNILISEADEEIAVSDDEEDTSNPQPEPKKVQPKEDVPLKRAIEALKNKPA